MEGISGPSRPPVFGPHDFAATVGLWLPYSHTAAGKWLSPFLSTENFEFTPEEYLDLCERIRQTIRVERKPPRATGGLEDLHTGFFRHREMEEAMGFLKEQLDVYIGKASDLYRRYAEALNDYGRRAVFQHRAALNQREKDLEQLEVLAAEPRNRRSMVALQADWSAYRLKWMAEDDRQPLTNEDLAAERQQLQAEQARDGREQAAQALALSELNVDPALGDAEALRTLAEELRDLTQGIDEAGIYQLPVSGTQPATTARQRQALGTLLRQLIRTRHHLPDLPEYHAYRRFWYAQPARLRRLLSPLLELPKEQWITAFSAWYFDRCLEKGSVPAGQQPTIPEGEALSAEHAAAAWLEKCSRIAPGAAIPENTEVLIDLSGGEPPAGFKGTFHGLRPLGNRSAVHYALAGYRDPRLALLQVFHPIGPAAWSSVGVEAPPPATNGDLSVQSDKDQPWQAFTSWEAGPVAHLRLFLPREMSAEAAARLLDSFDQIILDSEQITLYHNWSQNDITQALLSDGFNARFVAAALLRAAEACDESPFDQEALLAIGGEVRARCGLSDPRPHPLAEALQPLLQEMLPDSFLTVHQAWRDTFLPLVVLSPTGKKTVLLPGGHLPGHARPAAEAARQKELRVAGMDYLSINAYACWADVETEVRRLVSLLSDAS